MKEKYMKYVNVNPLIRRGERVLAAATWISRWPTFLPVWNIVL